MYVAGMEIDLLRRKPCCWLCVPMCFSRSSAHGSVPLTDLYLETSYSGNILHTQTRNDDIYKGKATLHFGRILGRILTRCVLEHSSVYVGDSMGYVNET